MELNKYLGGKLTSACYQNISHRIKVCWFGQQFLQFKFFKNFSFVYVMKWSKFDKLGIWTWRGIGLEIFQIELYKLRSWPFDLFKEAYIELQVAI